MACNHLEFVCAEIRLDFFLLRHEEEMELVRLKFRVKVDFYTVDLALGSGKSSHAPYTDSSGY